MSELVNWLDRRSPPPPPELAMSVREGLFPIDGADPPPEALTTAALARLRRARGRPGRVRASAFHLMAADALVTYACEAALESADPQTTLLDILERGSSP